MKSAYAFILILSTLPGLARADAYDDRQNLNQARENQNAMQKLQMQFAKARAAYLQNLATFGKSHSGYAQAPDCFDFSYSPDSRSMWNRVRQECGSGICAQVHGEGDGLFSSRYANDPTYQEIKLRNSMIYYCKVLLRNGLACRVGHDFDNGTFGGNCLDANGGNHDLSVPAVEGRPRG